MQIGVRRAVPAPAPDVAVEAREALLPVAVDVAGELVSRLLHRVEERAEQRVDRGTALEHQRTGITPVLVGAGQARLHALEVRQAMRVRPLGHARIAGPPLE